MEFSTILTKLFGIPMSTCYWMTLSLMRFRHARMMILGLPMTKKKSRSSRMRRKLLKECSSEGIIETLDRKEWIQKESIPSFSNKSGTRSQRRKSASTKMKFKTKVHAIVNSVKSQGFNYLQGLSLRISESRSTK